MWGDEKMDQANKQLKHRAKKKKTEQFPVRGGPRVRARDLFSCCKRQGEDERKETVEENEVGRGKIGMPFGTWNKQNTI